MTFPIRTDGLQATGERIAGSTGWRSIDVAIEIRDGLCLHGPTAKGVASCLRCLARIVREQVESPERKAKIWSDLIRPNVKLLAEFCSNVSFDDEREPRTDNTGCDV